MAVKPLTKAQLVSALSEKSGMTKVDVNKFLDTLQKTAVSETKKNGQFTLPGFGKLVKSHRKARTGRNPQTGEDLMLGARRVVSFKCSGVL